MMDVPKKKIPFLKDILVVHIYGGRVGLSLQLVLLFLHKWLMTRHPVRNYFLQ